jgi:hypothetical protein
MPPLAGHPNLPILVRYICRLFVHLFPDLPESAMTPVEKDLP